jgi:glutathione S-transferase
LADVPNGGYWSYARYDPELEVLKLTANSFFPSTGQANHFRLVAKVHSSYAIERYVEETKRLYSVLESRLLSHDWLAGDKYTIADIASFCWARNADLIEIDLHEFPNVEKWVARIELRDAAKRGISLPPSINSPQERSEMFAALRRKVDAMKNID